MLEMPQIFDKSVEVFQKNEREKENARRRVQNARRRVGTKNAISEKKKMHRIEY